MKYFLCLFLFLIFSSCSDEDPEVIIPVESKSTFYRGMDLSFTSENEANRVELKTSQNMPITNTYEFIANKGVNLVRLRLWVDGSSHPYGLENLKAEALKIKAAGMDLLLDFHYSGYWADPGQQTIPQAWLGLDLARLENQIYNYTRQVLIELNLQGTPPAFVQIGNETNNGMLWPYGQIYNNGNEDWSGYIALSKQAITATRETTPEAQIIIHHAGIDTAPYFYEQIADRNLDFDMIGLSYYPWWHGDDVSSLSRKLTSLHSENLDKKIMVVETAYPFTLDWNDNLNNIIGLPSQAAPDYPATPVGQAKFLRDIRKAVQSLPNDAGAGFCYWAPEWVAYPSSSYSFMQGSSWENLALFGFDGVELEGMGVFAE